MKNETEKKDETKKKVETESVSSKETATMQIPAEQQQETRAEEKPVVEKQTKFLESTDDDDETKLLEIQAVAVSAKNDTEAKEIEANELIIIRKAQHRPKMAQTTRRRIQLKISTAQFLLNKLPKACYMNTLS